MNAFYKRIQLVFKYSRSNRNQFCKKYGHNYQTLQSYWNTEKLPPGNVLADLAREYHVSLDVLILGVSPRPVAVENPLIRSIVRSLEKLGKDDLLRFEGAMRMFGYLVETNDDADTDDVRDTSDPDDGWATLEEEPDEENET